MIKILLPCQAFVLRSLETNYRHLESTVCCQHRSYCMHSLLPLVTYWWLKVHLKPAWDLGDSIKTVKTSVETVIEKRSFDRRRPLDRPKDDSVTDAILSISWKCSQHETWELGFKNWGFSHRTCLSSYRMIKKKKQVAHQNTNNNTRFCCFSSQSCRVLPRNFTNRIQLINFIG